MQTPCADTEASGTRPGLAAGGERGSLSLNSIRTSTVHINIYCKEGFEMCLLFGDP